MTEGYIYEGFKNESGVIITERMIKVLDKFFKKFKYSDHVQKFHDGDYQISLEHDNSYAVLAGMRECPVNNNGKYLFIRINNGIGSWGVEYKVTQSGVILKGLEKTISCFFSDMSGDAVSISQEQMMSEVNDHLNMAEGEALEIRKRINN